MALSPLADLQSLYRNMLRIRAFEERTADLVEAGEIRTPCHFCIGQEAVAVGICNDLRVEDTIWGAHRSHGHYLAKGGDLPALMAEIFCRSTGCSHGRGGSMHVCDPAQGVMGTVPIVAATIPIAAGAGLAAKLRNNGDVSVTFFGDGATEEGHFHESLNLAGVHGLPVLFVCENNFYSSHMTLAQRRREDNIPASGQAHGIPSLRVDGNDVLAVREAAQQAVERARSGGGPTLIECRTFRWRGHVGPAWDMDVGVKRQEDLAVWLERDPLLHCVREMEKLGLTPSELQQIQREVATEIDQAVEFARQSPHPAASDVAQHVYFAA